MMKQFPEIPLDKMRSVVGRFGISGVTQTLKIKVRTRPPCSTLTFRNLTGLMNLCPYYASRVGLAAVPQKSNRVCLGVASPPQLDGDL